MAETKEAKAPSETKFSRERLIAEAEAALGQPPHVVAGALADQGGTGDMTISAAKNAVDKFLKREVRED